LSEPAGEIWRDGGFVEDPWIRADGADDAVIGEGQALLVAYAAFVADPGRFVGRNGPLGVEVSAGEPVDALEPHLARLQLIAVVFPKFSDGRSYSAARLLRERFGYKGEIRATGDVLADQIPLMRRCGIDSLEIRHAPTRRALLEGRIAEVRHYYQPIPNGTEAPAGTRPWLRLPNTPRTD
jgi:phosphoadenosine phosphosulfate reductase